MFWLALPAQAAGKLTYEVQGLKGEPLDNVRTYLDGLPAYQPHQLRAVRDKIREAVTRGLQAVGYYQPEITLTRDPKVREKMLIKINAGKPVRVRHVDILLRGDAGQDEAFSQLLDKLPLKEGEIFHHGRYESIKSSLGSLGLSRGYFDARLRKSEVKVYPDQQAADILILFDAGRRYHYGDIRYEASPEAVKLIRPLIRIHTGEPYLATDLAEMSQNVSATSLFRETDIRPVMAEAKDGIVPVRVTLTPRDKHEVEAGIGFSTDEGPRVSGSWEKPWVNSYGHKLKTEFKVSQPKAEVSLDYQIPVGNPLEDYYSVLSGFKHEDLNDTQSDLTTVGLHRWKKKSNGWDRDLYFRVLYEDYVQASESGNSLLLLPGVSWSRLRMRGGPVPSWGDRQQWLVEVSDPSWGSDISFIRTWGRTKWLRTLGDDHRFLLRAEQGAIIGDSFSKVPSSLRFFTGGDQTVRGFDYESISPTDSNGELLGARYVTAASAEYNYRFSERWLGALFVDGGTATNDYTEAWKIGTGLGVRWVTPVGMVRVDVAVGVSEPDKPWRLHFALGPDL
ncbi:autotransporter secretion outer membrane protein TamA [Aeromonas sp. RU39B]|nr:autotransporter assembly complex family protein [Aeromonas sp. RU39B]SIQ00763.1 autotransporter secretion outer membrane protein TamA [Aeromonas sp. RU39B]